MTRTYQARAGDHEVSRSITTWYGQGFFLSFIIMILAGISTVGGLIKQPLLLKIGTFGSGCCQLTLWSVWFFYGTYLRFSVAGNYCSGNKLQPARSALIRDINRQLDWDPRRRKFLMPAGYLQYSGAFMKVFI